ncbi:hypothetical protein [Spirosoma endophyticum]|uniref:PH domain-containing protein n=1 Tax=Spirosoma endophyticum TaxID=662367 RepID=A0A1I1YBN0_9BACT|nr:hypothetical protein [Spirosoma endophyticum]SFE16961.1 hypothetical protein SAMN05216167_1115 [Spirosoma endophyticum]
MEPKVIFSEVQVAKQNKVIIYLLYLSISAIIIAVLYLLINNQFDLYSFLLFTLILTILILIANSKFILVITEKEIMFRYFPFILNQRIIRIDEIKTIRAQAYDPISEFGGWGIRKSGKKKLYSMSGNNAIIVEKNNGDIYYFGTRKAEEFNRVANVFV